jgi:class 3 adenylate cyclase
MFGFDHAIARSGLTISSLITSWCFLADPRDDHAVVMVRFASDCLLKMTEVTQALELELGPGTGDLTMRFGLHSGPVTAGVLRGQKSRFQVCMLYAPHLLYATLSILNNPLVSFPVSFLEIQ